MNPHQELANAIIQQAATDHRRAVKFLKAHPHTEELDGIVAKQIKERKARIKFRRESGLPPVPEKKSTEEILLRRIMRCEELVVDTEEFFLSDWISELTELNGVWLLEKLRKMEEAE